MTATRTERDSMGELQVPENALYGAQTQRAIQNFHLLSLRTRVDYSKKSRSTSQHETQSAG